MSHGGSSLKVILGSLIANVGIAVAKAVAAVLTGSGALAAEAVHSAADCSNQVLLLIGGKQAEKPADAEHPLGHGRSAYFWSFLVALMIFFGGGVVSIREGVHKLLNPEPVERPLVGFVVLVVSLGLEFAAALQAWREIERKRGKLTLPQYLHATTETDLVLLFAENAAAVLGLLIALVSLTMTVVTGDPAFDGAGSIVIGLLLMCVAWFVAREVKSLLDGERADPIIEAIFREEAARDARLGDVLRILTVQQGPAQVLIAAKLNVQKGLVSQELVEAFNALEKRVKARRSDVLWQFLEPDFEA